MLLRPFLNDATSCASYLFGCGTRAKLAVVDPHAELVDDYLATAAAVDAPIVAVFETHVQADHVSGLPDLVARTGATAYLPAETGVEFAVAGVVQAVPATAALGSPPSVWCASQTLGFAPNRAKASLREARWPGLQRRRRPPVRQSLGCRC